MTILNRFKALAPSLQASIMDVVFYSIMFGAGESYIQAYAISLQLTPLQIGLLSSVPLLLGACGQLLGVKLMERSLKRQTIIVSGAFCQSLCWIPIAAIPLLFDPSYFLGWLLIACVSLYFICGSVVVPSWTSLMGDLVPVESRGAFFGLRSQISGYVLIASFFVCGYVVQLAQGTSLEVITFSFFFLIAFLARLGSVFYLRKHREPRYIFAPNDAFSFVAFLRRLPNSNFAKFTLFYAAYQFSFLMVAPYFIVWILRELQLSYWDYTVMAGAWLCSNFLMMQFWGKFSDRFGNRKVLAICACGLSVMPLCWALHTSVLYLTCIQLLAGIFTSGFTLSGVNFLFDAVSPGKRGRCIAYLSILNAFFIVFGSLFGSLVLYVSSLYFAAPYQFITLFLLSSAVRMSICYFLLPLFHEVRVVDSIPTVRPLYRIGKVQPFVSTGLSLTVGVFKNQIQKRGNKKKTSSKSAEYPTR